MSKTGNRQVVQVKVPVPFPLMWVNGYLLAGPSGYTLIDPGLNTEEAVARWETVLEEMGIGYEAISQIVLTHHHPDHYGLAGWFQERTGAPVYLSPSGQCQVERMWGEEQPLTGEILRLFGRHGMEEERLPFLEEHLNSFVAQVSPQPFITPLYPGQSLEMGGRLWEAIETNGHAQGHLCFYDADAREMICGDQVMPRISPNVSYIPGMDENPLASYLKSLRHLSGFEVEMAYPGHRDPFTGFADRAMALIDHHRDRLDQMLSRLEEPMTAYRLCLEFFGTRLSIHQLRFALSETLAHLIYLREEGLAEERDKGGVIVFNRC